MCGVTAGPLAPGRTLWGLSPRVRSYHAVNLLLGKTAGSISACAELPDVNALRTSIRRVYLRVCGVTAKGLRHVLEAEGLSPRVRSYQHLVGGLVDKAGSISACAELPRGSSACGLRLGVYLRVCGVTRQEPECADANSGLSPRVRSYPSRRSVAGCILGSISACAELPRFPLPAGGKYEVYLRVCGVTSLPVASRWKI